MKRPSIPCPSISCPACHGEGQRPLSPPLHRCLTVIGKLGKATVPEIAAKLGEDVHPTAINRRVKTLVTLGLVEAHKNGIGVRRYKVK